MGRSPAIAALAVLTVSAFSLAASAQTAPPAKPPPVELSSLRLMLDKGLISRAEYETAIGDLRETLGSKAADATSVVVGKWSTTFYGFVDADYIYDSTQSFNDAAGNAQVARPGTYAGDNGRSMIGVRNSRIGFRLAAPEYKSIRTSAMLEMDFLGAQGGATEGATFTNPVLRVRHFNMKVETPVVDFLAGQYWQLFGWQSAYHPNTVEIQGVPGEVYGRTPQLRISKTLRTDGLTFEVAIAAMRPPQRDSAVPEGQAGMRFAINHWTGMQTVGATGTSVAPASIAVTGDVRHIKVAEFNAAPKDSSEHTGTAIAVNAFVPVIPAKVREGNALSLTGEFASGFGTADLYSGLTGGVAFPALPNPNSVTPAPVFTPNIDPGIAVYDITGRLHYIQWTSFIVGAQYYLPELGGKVWLSGNFSRLSSNNTSFYTAAAKVRKNEEWFDVNLFADVTPAVRLGFEYARFKDTYGVGVVAIHHRAQMSAFYLF